jgi:peroxiredoxin
MNENIASPLLGPRAPDFTLPRTRHASFALRDVLGRPAVLVFYPGDWEPVSAEQLGQYQEYLPELQRFDAALVAISVDSVCSHAAFGKALDLGFPLLSDFHPKGHVSRAYHVYREEEGRSGRALFVLDPDGMICWSRSVPTNLNPGVHGILSALESLHVARSPPLAKRYR